MIGSDGGTTEGGTHPPGTDTGVTPGHDGGTGADATHPGTDANGGADVSVPTDSTTGVDAPVYGPDAVVDGAVGSRCAMSATSVSCPFQQLTEMTADANRVVLYELPLGTPPTSGWPVVINFQATDLSPVYAFQATTTDIYATFGVYYQAALTKNLLDAGFAVIAPSALTFDDSTFWETNISPYATSWSGTGDDELMQKLFTDIAAGTFGKLDSSSMYATGLSSGGYMTSRMALSYPGKFKALAIESGSWATCLSGAGPSGEGTCTIPSPLPAMHPPTLLLHGNLDTVIIPELTVTEYVNALTASGIPEKEVDDTNSGHQWIPEAPSAVLAWFQTYK